MRSSLSRTQPRPQTPEWELEKMADAVNAKGEWAVFKLSALGAWDRTLIETVLRRKLNGDTR